MKAEFFTRHGLPVSRETAEKLRIYDALLRKWQKTINLVSVTTLEEAATRHFLDSAQLLGYLPDKDIALADMGTGAGFPGMVLAICGMTNIHLIESDLRKAAFLHTVSRETETTVTIHDCRVEEAPLSMIDVVTARALAPLTALLGHMARMGAGCGLFLKGRSHVAEISDAHILWDFRVETFPSLTDSSGAILRITDLARR